MLELEKNFIVTDIGIDKVVSNPDISGPGKLDLHVMDRDRAESVNDRKLPKKKFEKFE